MRAVVTLVLSLMVAGIARADVDQAINAWKSGDYRTAVEGFKAGAQEGDARAQFYLGEAYNFGRGVLQDYAEALKWYRQSLNSANPCLYRKGLFF